MDSYSHPVLKPTYVPPGCSLQNTSIIGLWAENQLLRKDHLVQWFQDFCECCIFWSRTSLKSWCCILVHFIEPVCTAWMSIECCVKPGGWTSWSHFRFSQSTVSCPKGSLKINCLNAGWDLMIFPYPHLTGTAPSSSRGNSYWTRGWSSHRGASLFVSFSSSVGFSKREAEPFENSAMGLHLAAILRTNQPSHLGN